MAVLAFSEIVFAGEYLSGDTQPILREHGLQRLRRGAFHAHHHVAPAFALDTIPDPPVGNAGASDEGDRSIYDQQFSMGAVIELRNISDAQRVIPADLSTSIEQFLQVAARHA